MNELSRGGVEMVEKEQLGRGELGWKRAELWCLTKQTIIHCDLAKPLIQHNTSRQPPDRLTVVLVYFGDNGRVRPDSAAQKNYRLDSTTE